MKHFLKETMAEKKEIQESKMSNEEMRKLILSNFEKKLNDNEQMKLYGKYIKLEELAEDREEKLILQFYTNEKNILCPVFMVNKKVLDDMIARKEIQESVEHLWEQLKLCKEEMKNNNEGLQKLAEQNKRGLEEYYQDTGKEFGKLMDRIACQKGDMEKPN